jgi:hypothetical protein
VVIGVLNSEYVCVIYVSMACLNTSHVSACFGYQKTIKDQSTLKACLSSCVGVGVGRR